MVSPKTASAFDHFMQHQGLMFSGVSTQQCLSVDLFNSKYDSWYREEAKTQGQQQEETFFLITDLVEMPFAIVMIQYCHHKKKILPKHVNFIGI